MGKKGSNYQSSWEITYGVKPVAHDIDNSVVTNVVCQFCQACGRENDSNERKQSTLKSLGEQITFLSM